MNRRSVLAALSATLLSACASSKVSTNSTPNQTKAQVKVIAFAPGGGLLADAVGVELANRGIALTGEESEDPTPTPIQLRVGQC